MDIKEIKITVPEGMEIDREHSTFECIKFKKKEEIPWRNKKENPITGWYIRGNYIKHTKISSYISPNYDTYATEKQAKSALAMAQISQIMANDERFGGAITDEEWDDNDIWKEVICRFSNTITFNSFTKYYYFLAFHTEEQRALFLKENEDLVKQYLMID